jgi:aspartokinase
MPLPLPCPAVLCCPALAVLCCAVQSNVVYKFGGSSVRDAERMREVADIICSFPQYLPCVVLSAMGTGLGSQQQQQQERWDGTAPGLALQQQWRKADNQTRIRRG